MTRKRHSSFGAALAAAYLATGCSGGGGFSGGETGSLSLGLIDSPATEAAEIWLSISVLRLKPHGDGPPIEFLFDPPMVENLLELTADAPAWLLNGETVPAGEYNWLELELNADIGVRDSYVITFDGLEQELFVPSNSLRLVSGFAVTANEGSEYLIDWDARRGLIKPPGLESYLLQPTYRLIDLTQYFRLSGTVDPALISTLECLADDAFPDPAIGNAVYVYDGLGVIPDDIDGVLPDPVAVVPVEQDGAFYVYSTLLTPGDYTLAFTCTAGNDDPAVDDPVDPATDGAVVFTPGVDLPDPMFANGEEVAVDF